MPACPPLFGFTLLRNGLKYDYCFREALKSLALVTEKTFLALGAGEDDTLNALRDLSFLEIIPTTWDEKLRAGGLILSQQTNVALNAAREANPDAWGIYLQCDEVLHQDDVELIRRDIAQAHAEGAEAVTFRYWHFWQTHHHVAINKKWYPQEIRAVRLGSKAESWGDAQSFRGVEKVFHSDARVFHYGHVRDPKKYLDKKRDILTLYHADEKLPKYRRREKRFDRQTEVLDFFGDHPQLMKERILRMGDIWELPRALEAHVVADPDEVSVNLKSRINAQKLIWHSSFMNVPRKHQARSIVLKPSLLVRAFHPSRVPGGMRSKLARPWDLDTLLMLRLSERGVGLASLG